MEHAGKRREGRSRCRWCTKWARRRSVGSAFTLIELLVVIAIISLLLAILVPSLNKAKQQVKFVLCKNNLKSYGVVAIMYTFDNQETMPNAWTSFYNRHGEYPPDADYPQPEPHRYCRWHNPRFDLTVNPQYAGPLWPYLESRKVQMCPTFIQVARQFGDKHPEHRETIPIVPNYNYAMNQHLGERKIVEIKNQSQIFFFSEENLWVTAGWSTFAFNDTALCVIKDAHNSFSDGIQPWDSFGTFHNAKDEKMETGVVNAVFVDGHVQTVLREESQKFAIIDK